MGLRAASILLSKYLCPAAVPDTLKLAVDEYLCPAAVPDRAVLTSCPENECVCVGCVWLWLLIELATVWPTPCPEDTPRKNRPR